METTVFGKWILAGEHAVIRGGPALAFPVTAKSLSLGYIDTGEPLSVDFSGTHGADLRLLFWGVVERAFEACGQSRAKVTGRFTLRNSIPVGAGLGASATLCVAVGRWFEAQGWVRATELQEFCRQLENLFHGESSGLDIAVALTASGLHFERGGNRYSVKPTWTPQWYISYSGKRGVTSECVERVKTLWVRDHTLAASIDVEMREAVLECEQALTKGAGSFERLATAIAKARTCFDKWGLTGGEMGQHLDRLTRAGARAVKPTGSGDGGYALSLWESAPPADLAAELIPLSC